MAWSEHGTSRIHYEEEGGGDPLLIPGITLSIKSLGAIRQAHTMALHVLRRALRPSPVAGGLALMLLAVLAACSDDDDSASTAPTGSAAPAQTEAPTPTAAERGVTTRRFGVKASMTVPATWTGVNDEPKYFAVYRPRNREWTLVGIDLGIVGNVFADPCDTSAGMVDPPLGSTTDDLVNYMLGIEQLGAKRAGTVTIDGHEGQAIDEAFVSSADCRELVMWDVGSGVVFGEEERKRFVVLDYEGQRIVVVVVTHKPRWDELLPEAMGVVETLTFGE